ncbi:cell division protein FtsA [Sphingosinicella rhizophila]|uniref:Cell division protein FtsA n=1 Tax=Sphingosinicella rhizophila TaxID=3050082 RepID=A0ABU3Q507_9SPHN|nr:cell division protein FtsA [Sphingosinicella sp. GR2756]MDT9598048.1 cell division protein FtsA [Sphingosinicella sp. GR2756]
MKRIQTPPAQKLVTALDIGSSKVSALIAEPRENGELRILGTGQRQSQGVKRGFIADMERTEVAVREAVEQAERIAATNIESVFVGYSAGGLVSTVASVEVEIGGRRIEKEHIDALLGVGRDSIDPEGRMILHAMPALYTLDGLEGVKKPLGLHADRLAVDIHVIAAEPPPVRNLDLCVRSAHLGVDAIVASPVAAGKACLSEEERELGVALVELGAGVTNISVFAGGMLVGLKSLPLGGIDITDDIASAFGTRRAEAERMKCFYGSATTSPRDNHDMIELAPIAGSEEGTEAARITRAQLIAVIRQRLEQLTGDIAVALKELGFAGPFGRQVVLTGGGSELKGIADYAQGVLGRAVRVGRPQLAGLPEAHGGPAFTTLVGLAQFAASNELDLRQIVAPGAIVHKGNGGNLVQRLISAVKSGF